MNKFYSLFFLLTGLFLSLTIQVSGNPLVQFPSGPAAWTVNVTNSPKSNSTQPLAGNAIVKVEVTQNAEINCNLVSYASGISRASWGVAGTNLILMEDPAGTPFLTPTSKIFFIPYLPNVFEWLRPELLQEKTPVSYQDKPCFHYKETTPLIDLNGKSIGVQTREAWINSKTLLPVALDDGVLLASFTFHPPPTAALVLPDKFKKILDNYMIVMGKPKSH